MRVAIVTGGTRGLGLATARALGANGWRLLLTYRADAETARAAVSALAAAGVAAESMCLDAGSPRASADLSAQALLTSASRLVVVHNAAAAFTPTPIHLLDWDQFQLQLDVGLRGLVSLAQAAVPRMARTGGGVIAVVLSQAILGVPPKGFAAYAAAKQAMRSLVQSLAVEHGARGVRTLGVCPGFMVTSLTEGWNPILQRAVRQRSATDVDAAGREIARLVEAAGSKAVPGAGEEYPV